MRQPFIKRIFLLEHTAYLLSQRSVRLATMIIQPLPLTTMHDDLFYRDSWESLIAGIIRIFFFHK